MQSNSDFLQEFFDSFDKELASLDEASYLSRAEKSTLMLEVLDIDKYVKVNELKPITNPTFFGLGGAPTSDGLLSNEIFGITQKDRAGTFAYIDLYEYFIDPSCFKTLCRLDSKFKEIAAGTKKYRITSDGQLEEDNEKGGTGIKWLKANFSKIKFKRTDSRARDMRIRYINHNAKLGRIFINKYLVIPPYYRDVNTASRKRTGVGQINTLYVRLITAVNSIKENDDYGLSMADTTCFRVQDTIKTIYDWFCGNTNPNIVDKGTGLSGKLGIIKGSNMNYTADYSARLVLTAPELKVETPDDLMSTLDKSAVPLSAVAAIFYPFMLFHIRKFFENIFLNNTDLYILDKNGKEIPYNVSENMMMYFSDDVIKDNLKQFIHSHDNRFKPISVPVKNMKNTYLRFSGQSWRNPKDITTDPEPIIHRPLTWVDVIYLAAKRSSDGKQIIITRYPHDLYFNTIYTGIEVSSTTETEPIIYQGEFYPFYPKIRMEDIGTNTKTRFVDTMRISNLYLGGMRGDYDGDTVQIKGAYFNETNQEIINIENSKSNFIDSGCENVRQSSKEAIQALYNLTLVLREDQSKLTDPKF